jgi:peptide deformylase
MTNPPVERTADAFATELAQWRAERGFSKKQLAAEMGFDPSYVSHVEARRHRPTEDFARRADAVLRAGGAIWQRFREYDEARRAEAAVRHAPRDPPLPEQWFPPGTGLVVDHEEASLSFVDGAYQAVVRRSLFNAGTEPVTRYLVRISVDRYPNEPERSNAFYREQPLTWDELNLTAHSGGEPMLWRAKHDRDAFKEVWLLFENEDGRFPLYPGQRTTIEYAYRVGENKWGQWFQRAVRLPTRRLTVRLDFPSSLDPAVWGVETSLTSEARLLRTPVHEQRSGGRARFEWVTDDPPLNARFRLEWRFRGVKDADVPVTEARPSERMALVGIVQRGASVLSRPARQFDLPADADRAIEIVGRLREALDQVVSLHHFTKGVGLAAPQLNIGWAAAVVRPVGADAEQIVLLNPRILAEAPDRDEQYEGCLSFFDSRGRVPRALLIEVEHTDLSGERHISVFERGLARLVAHEIDHLNGVLYTERMPPERRLVPVEEYGEHGRPWLY